MIWFGYFTLLFIFYKVSEHGILSQAIPKLNPFDFPKDLTTGSRARVLCSAYLGDQPLDFRWLKDGKKLFSGKIQQLDASISELILEPLGLQHIGNYTCIVSNTYGSDNFTASLFVKAPPMWIISPEDMKVRVGETVALHCEANGSPDVHITWRRRSVNLGNLIPVTPSSNLWILKNNTLVISNIQKSDDGVYICEASNGVGENLRKSAQITVYERPVMHRTENALTAEKGQEAYLTCFANEGSSLTLMWSKNNKPLNDLPDILNRFSFSEHLEGGKIRFVLKIMPVELDDEGIYTCIGENEFGSDEKDIRLLVIEKPYPPEFLEVADIWSRSARIRWSVPSDGNSPINSYRVEYWSDSGSYQNETVSSATTSYTLRDLSPSTLYHLRVWAANKVGMSDPSEQQQFTTANEEPSAPPMDTFIEEKGSTFVRLSWKPPPPQDWNGGLSGYYVGYKKSSSKLPYTFNTVELNDNDNTVHYVLRGLHKGTRYVISIKAYNEIGSGPSSQEMSFKTLNQEPPPRPNLMVKNIGSTYIQLQWFFPADPKVTGFTLYYRKAKDKWQEISIPDVKQTSFTLTNLDIDVAYQIFMTSHSNVGMSEPSDTATVRTSAEPIIQSNEDVSLHTKPAVDEFTQVLYIVIPVSVATVIIVVVIVAACVYVYSKRPVPPSLPYDFPPDKNFCYMATAPRRRDPTLPVCGMDMVKQGSPYSTVPLTRTDIEEEEPIYESVMEEIRCKLKQRSFDDEKKISSGTIV